MGRVVSDWTKNSTISQQGNLSIICITYYMYIVGLFPYIPLLFLLPQKDLLHPNQLCIATTDFDGQEESVS